MDVGEVINQEMHGMIAKRTWKESVGLPTIISVLCPKMGVPFMYSPKDEVPLKSSLSQGLSIPSASQRKTKITR